MAVYFDDISIYINLWENLSDTHLPSYKASKTTFYTS